MTNHVGWHRCAARLLLLAAAVLCCLGARWQQSRVPILMYHHIAAEPNGNSMILTPARFSQDMQYLVAQGYTPLLTEELTAIQRGEMPMPRRPIVITFDDGYASNYTEAYPILQQYGMKAIIAVIAADILPTSADGAYMLSWPQCREMSESGLVEIGCHSYALHNNDNGGSPYPDGHDGIQRKAGERKDAYTRRVGDDLDAGCTLIAQQVGRPCRYFSYPFGAGDDWFLSLAKRRDIAVITTTRSRMAHLFFGLTNLPRYHMDMDHTAQQALSPFGKDV